ncbi:MAG: potassium-transporting ATPase subunit KdpA [Bacillota bacterium]|nr:potassium-transporting ATPase subunit KdpA [Bacillota bacterium]
MLGMAILLLLALLLGIPTGRYLYLVFFAPKAPGDGWLRPVETFLLRLIGVREPYDMDWKVYSAALLGANGFMALLGYVLLRQQGNLPWNPLGAPGMSWHLAFNTAASFITNTNLQHYAGETQISPLSQMAVITFLMHASAATGLAAGITFIRGVTGRPLGNFWSDFIKASLRVLWPASLLVSLLLVSQGVPQTFTALREAHTLEGTLQTLLTGPIASFESIKHLGTNGGGYFSANAAHPFENPTPFTNLLHMLSMLWIPISLLFTFGDAARNRRLPWVFFSAAAVIFVGLYGILLHAEDAGDPLLHRLGIPGPNWEGKEVRFGMEGTSLFVSVTTGATTGSVDSAHGSLMPWGQTVPLLQMMLNSIFGGIGVGTMNLLTMALLTVFLIGLMVGRTPEFLGRKVEPREMTLLAAVILIHPLLILIPTAVALSLPQGIEGLTAPTFQGLTQALYEFASSAANNGSGMGIDGDQAFWNVSTGLVMLLGRYPSIVLLLALADSLRKKRAAPLGPGSLRLDTPLFTGILAFMTLLLGALNFFPALAMGPLAQALMLP